jgi:L-alanine-DL-glutamate epimerase-like enolase superfamily enzyme
LPPPNTDISALDTALWDLAARILQLPLVTLLGQVRESVPVYGSGGFTSYTVDQLQRQLADWVDAGIPRVKMKVGRVPEADPERVRRAREAIGPDAELFVDANGAYHTALALRMADRFAESGVTWLEEPRPSEDTEALAHIRARAPRGLEIAAGEYADSPRAMLALLHAHAADVLQPDVTRCGGFTGLARIAALCHAHHVPISLHCAPALAVHAACAAPGVRHIEYFHDHARLESLLFDGVAPPEHGHLRPDPGRPGNGLTLIQSQVERYRG